VSVTIDLSPTDERRVLVAKAAAGSTGAQA
jgi:hypothetical protein